MAWKRALIAGAAVVLVAGLLAGAGQAGAESPQRVDNPYAGARVYVNPSWSARAAAEPGGSAIADQPTGVWLDSMASIGGLRGHLDAALAQGANLIQLVLYNAPGRACGRLLQDGELAAGELDRYRRQFVDPIARILGSPRYAGLRIVTVVEPNSLPYLVTHVTPRVFATPECNAAKAAGTYVQAIGYALARLGALPNVYNYLDISHHGHIGWRSDRVVAADIYVQAASAAGSTPANVAGFIANLANFSVTKEEFFAVDDVISGQPVLATRWVDWNDFIDELTFARVFRDELVIAGFGRHTGVLIDTSRNGWGGPNRPTRTSTSTDPQTYVNESRIDRRASVDNFCNQAGSGLGARPVAAPEPGVDAYVWMKPPGESDGDVSEPMCDPTYLRFPPSEPPPTGALPDAPPAGEWFPSHFQELLRNAHPPL
jgi:cellulose 1,4-beta-cellobiosidase